MKRAWVVFGSAGQYEDQEEWTVAVFTSRADAERWRDAAAAYADAFKELATAWNEKHERDENWPKGRPVPRRHFDKGLTYNRAYDVGYGVVCVPLDPTAPAPRRRKRP